MEKNGKQKGKEKVVTEEPVDAEQAMEMQHDVVEHEVQQPDKEHEVR